jgi:nucleotide-binding universal stress UspA family protein
MHTQPADKQILVPLSLAQLGESKLPVAVAQARALGAQILLLHVIPRARGSHPEVDELEARARTYLEIIAARLRSEGVDAHLLIRHGPVAETILEEIRERRSDLVVIGTDVRSGVAKALLGSVANRVVAGAPCPVVLVKPHPGKIGGDRSVRSFTEDLKATGPVSPHDIGLRMVDPARIIGSVPRARELDERFRIRKASHSERDRYSGLLAAMERGESMPPVVLYKLGYGYYVVEGHRRVAAAKQLGLSELAAEVRDFVPVADALGRQVFLERLEFEISTGLTQLGAALPGHYARLKEMIRRFAEERQQKILPEAARLWEATAYRPAASIIRSSGWNEHFPDLRTADIFLILSDAKERLSRRDGRRVEWDEALSSLLAQGVDSASRRGPHHENAA